LRDWFLSACDGNSDIMVNLGCLMGESLRWNLRCSIRLTCPVMFDFDPSVHTS
jgi:hypothetical protein